MKFNSQICTTRSQSERLLALGIKAETADMHHYKWSEGYWDIQACPRRGSEPYYIPAWSLHRLIQMMPSSVYQGESIRYFMIEQGHNVGYWYFGEDECELCKIWYRKDLYNNIIDSIEWLIEKGYFNKEYLEE